MKNVLKKGTIYETLAGYDIVTGSNGPLIDVDSYIVDMDGNSTFEGEFRKTAKEIATDMREVDGLNHTVIYKS